MIAHASNSPVVNVTSMPIPPFNPPSKASAKMADLDRLQSIKQQSREERLAREGRERAGTIWMGIATVIGLAVFGLFWWLVVQ